MVGGDRVILHQADCVRAVVGDGEVPVVMTFAGSGEDCRKCTGLGLSPSHIVRQNLILGGI